jgi:hypothetical protein
LKTEGSDKSLLLRLREAESEVKNLAQGKRFPFLGFGTGGRFGLLRPIHRRGHLFGPFTLFGGNHLEGGFPLVGWFGGGLGPSALKFRGDIHFGYLAHLIEVRSPFGLEDWSTNGEPIFRR